MKAREFFAVVLLLMAACLLAACVVARGTDPNTGATWELAMTGTDADDLDVKATCFHGKKINQSKGLKIVADTVLKMWQAYLMQQGLEFVAGQYYKLEGSKVSSATRIELEKLRNARSAAEASAQLERLRVMEPLL